MIYPVGKCLIFNNMSIRRRKLRASMFSLEFRKAISPALLSDFSGGICNYPKYEFTLPNSR